MPSRDLRRRFRRRRGRPTAPIPKRIASAWENALGTLPRPSSQAQQCTSRPEPPSMTAQQPETPLFGALTGNLGHIAPSRSTSNRKHFDFPCDQSIFRARSRSQTALAAPSPVFCPRARPCSLNHRRGYAFGREHAHGAKILGDHRGPWRAASLKAIVSLAFSLPCLGRTGKICCLVALPRFPA